MKHLLLPPVGALTGDVRLPGSKSISNRALLLAAQARGTTRLLHLLDSDDTAVMLKALHALGVRVQRDGEACLVHGLGGPLRPSNAALHLDLGLAGTAYRPLAAALTLARGGEFILDGTARMRERPVGHLVDALRELGAKIAYLGESGYPPLRIHGTGLTGGTTHIDGSISSQFLTALLMALPLAEGRTRVELTSELVSKPYIDITLAMLARFGVTVSHEDYRVFHATPQPFVAPGDFLVEGDASSASYFLAAGAIRGDGITVHGIGAQSIQGDVAFVEVLENMGANVTMDADRITVRPGTLKALDMDLNHIPDAAMTAAVLALFADGTTTIRNIGNWRVKETDRLQAMATELRKFGATVIEGADFISVTPPATINGATVETYGDHRIAMCFSLLALAGVPVTIVDPDCVAKTFPDYFQVFDSLRVN
ncbi:MAG: 3-phosphoshikimate 1-carboxyvinyltransferase [Pseudomonadales bacterium]